MPATLVSSTSAGESWCLKHPLSSGTALLLRQTKLPALAAQCFKAFVAGLVADGANMTPDMVSMT